MHYDENMNLRKANDPKFRDICEEEIESMEKLEPFSKSIRELYETPSKPEYEIHADPVFKKLCLERKERVGECSTLGDRKPVPVKTPIEAPVEITLEWKSRKTELLEHEIKLKEEMKLLLRTKKLMSLIK